MRLFFAVAAPPLPPWDPDREEGADAGTRSPVHLTVRFLGDQPESMREALMRAGRTAVEGIRPFPIELGPIGAFPSPRAPRIVWLGLRAGDAEMRRLEGRLAPALALAHIRTETRPFVPHVTWRRVRSRSDERRAEEWLRQGTLPTPIPGIVDALYLKESELTARGAVHRTWATFPLIGAE